MKHILDTAADVLGYLLVAILVVLGSACIIATVASPTTKVEAAALPWYTGLMDSAGIARGDQKYADWIIARESSWRPTVYNSTGSGAFGLCQSLPASKMASSGADYMTNPVTQLKWCNEYANVRYGGWVKAHAAWNRQHWW